MDKRWLTIIQLLFDEQTSVPMKTLEKHLGLSSKTIKTLLEQNQHKCEEHGFCLRYTFGLGYAIKVNDVTKLRQLLTQVASSGNEFEDRIQYVLKRLLQENDYVKIESLADELYVSRATIDRLMPALKEIASHYHLQVITRAKYGVCLEGSEFHKRMCYAHQVGERENEEVQSTISIVQKTLFTTLQNHSLSLSDANFYNLVQHCVIAIQRIMKGNLIHEVPPMITKEDIALERATAQDIIRQFEILFSITFPKEEEQYIVMHLLGKRVLDQCHAISEHVLQCVEDILVHIKEQKHIDLSNDMELKTVLALHLQPLLSRLRFDMKQENAILLDIKREMNLGFELAICAFQVLSDTYGFEMDEDEAGYLALHFAVALERLQHMETEKQIVIVCSTGRGTAKLIQHRLVHRYHFKAENLIITSSFQLAQIDFSNVICILSTIPLFETYPVPSVMIDMTMNQKSTEKLDQLMATYQAGHQVDNIVEQILLFPRLSFSSKEEALTFLCEQIKHQFDVDEDFEEQVVLRESLSSTEIGNLVALPHPQVYEKNHMILSFMTLEKPIEWKFGTVQLIVLMALPKQEDQTICEVHEQLTRIVSDESCVQELIQDLSRENIRRVFTGGKPQ